MPSEKRKIGDRGEREAEDFLIKNGYRILDRNYRIKNIGEIDLIGEKDGQLVFFEVKTRNSIYNNNFPIQLSINSRKRRILRKTCELYLMSKKELNKKIWRVDGVFINADKPEWDQSRIEHFKNLLWEKYY